MALKIPFLPIAGQERYSSSSSCTLFEYAHDKKFRHTFSFFILLSLSNMTSNIRFSTPPGCKYMCMNCMYFIAVQCTI